MVQTSLSGWRLVAPLMVSGALAGVVCTVAVNPVVSAAHLAAQGRTVSSPAASRIVTTAANATTILLADRVLPDGSEREGLSVIRRDAVHRLHARFIAKKARRTGNEWRLTGLQVLVAAPDGTSPVPEFAPDLLTGRFGNQQATSTLALPTAIACANAVRFLLTRGACSAPRHVRPD